MANNHLMDFGLEGLDSTNNHVRQTPGLFSAGAGKNVTDSRRPYIFQSGGTRLTLFSACDPQFGTAIDNFPGVAASGPWLYREISAAKFRGELVGISIHGGQEDIQIPSPKRMEFFRSLADCGADFVWGHHSHVPQTWEFYKGKLLAYGLGNFAVDPCKWKASSAYRKSLVFYGEISELGHFSWHVGRARIAETVDYSAAAEITVTFERDQVGPGLKALEKLGVLLRNPSLHEALWQEFAFQLFKEFGEKYMGWSSPSLRDYAVSFMQGRHTSSNRRNLLRFNMLTNEAHREMLETALGVMSGALRDHRNPASKALLRGLNEEVRPGAPLDI